MHDEQPRDEGMVASATPSVRPERETDGVTATRAALPLIPVPAAPEGHRYRRVSVERVAGACGAVIAGVDLASDPDDDVVAEIRRAVLDHKVVFFRRPRLTAEEQVA